MTVREPTAGDIANAKREADRGDAYSAMVEWCAGCIESLSGDGEIISRVDVRRAARALPFTSAMALAVAAKAEMDGDDGVSSVEECPYCGARDRRDRREADGEVIDSRDHVLELPVRCLPDGAGLTVSYDLQVPIEVTRRDTGEVAASVRSVTVRYPTLGDCSRASKADGAEAQLAILAEALEEVDGEPVSAAWKSTFGRAAFRQMKARDVNALSALLREYGMDPRVTRTCRSCGMEWDSEVNVMGFFASGLRK